MHESVEKCRNGSFSSRDISRSDPPWKGMQEMAWAPGLWLLLSLLALVDLRMPGVEELESEGFHCDSKLAGMPLSESFAVLMADPGPWKGDPGLIPEEC